MRISDWSSDVCSSDLPAQIVDVLYAAIGAARTERRHAVRGIAGKENALMPKPIHAFAGKGIDADPLQFELRVGAQQGAYAWNDVFRLDLFHRVGIPAQLEVYAPDIVGLTVQQHRLRSEEHTSELQSLMRISYAVFCLKKKKYI